VYKGNKLPPFYIGSTSVDKVKSGYHGSVGSKKYSKIYKKEIGESPHLFSTFVISFHDTRKAALKKENKLQRALKVVESPLYFNESFASENGFFGRDNSGYLNGFYGKKHSKESLAKISKPKSSAINYKKPKSKSHARNISKAQKGVSWTENKRKSMEATCIHCGFTTIKSNITKWHNDNCKYKIN
jgi:hypothetical protein